MRSTLSKSFLALCSVGIVVALTHQSPPSNHRKLARSDSSSDEVELVSAAYFTQWHADEWTLDDVSWEKFTHMYYAFKLTTEDPSNVTLPEADAELLPQFVAKAHDNGVKALLSIGGWTGSLFFSSNVGDATNRTKFAQAVNQLVDQYELDGVDFDWEYPNRQGIGCNTISANDSANFLLFLQELRSSADYLITAAVSLNPFNDENGHPLTDVSGFAKVFDFIDIMDYDVWGSWSSSVGPNAPLNDSCAAPAHQQGSAVSAVSAWSKAGIPVSQIVVGVASYGHAFNVNSSDAYNGTELAAYPPNGGRAAGDAWSDPAGKDKCGNDSPAGDTWEFWSLIEGGVLNEDGSPANGVPYRFDDCSQTEYIYNTSSSAMISYDGPASFASKGNFIKNTGLRGFSMWESGGDYNDLLLDAIRSAAGFDDSEW